MLVLALALPAVGFAQDSTERATLKGIDAVNLQVHCDPVIGEQGLTREEVSRMVVDKVRAAGLKVAEGGDNLPLLWVCVISTAKEDAAPDKSHAVLVAVELLQAVSLVRDTSINTFTRTWADEILALYAPAKMKGIKLDVGNILDKFIADWRAANP